MYDFGVIDIWKIDHSLFYYVQFLEFPFFPTYFVVSCIHFNYEVQV
jgi:hypothetical protein